MPIFGPAYKRLMPPRPLRVTHVVCTDAFAGVERYVCLLASGLASLGCSVTVIGGNSERMQQELSNDVRAFYPADNVLTACWQLGSLRSADIVHAHMTAAELASALFRPLSRNKLVVTRHIAAERGKTQAGHYAAALIRKQIDSEIAVTNFVAKFCSETAVVISPGVSNQSETPESLRQRRVLVAQRLEPEKDTSVALRAWAASGLGNEDWTLDIAGSGSEEFRLRTLADELSISQSVYFHGMRSDIQEFMQTSSLLLATSPSDSFGLSVVEAMASGLPVVASAGGGHLETVGLHHHAALYPPGDHLAAASLLRELAGDAGRRQRYGAELRMIQMRYFNSDEHTVNILNHYNRLLEWSGK